MSNSGSDILIEESFRSVYEKYPASIQFFTPKGEVIPVNKAKEVQRNMIHDDLKGYNIFRGKNLFEKSMKKFIRKGIKGEEVDIPEIKCTFLEKGIVENKWLKFYIRPVKNSSGKIFAVVLQHEDVTEKRKTQEMFSLLTAIVSSSDDAIITQSCDGIITNWNKASEKIFGYSINEAIGKNITMIIPQGLREEEEELIHKVKSGLHIDHFETKRMSKTGEIRTVSLSLYPVNNNSEIIGISMIARDITQTKVFEGRQRLRSLFKEMITLPVSLPVSLRKIVRSFVPVFADYCKIALIEENEIIKETFLYNNHYANLALTNELHREYSKLSNISYGIKNIIKTKKSEIIGVIAGTIPNLTELKHNNKLLEIIKKSGLISYMGIPLIARNKLIGVIILSSCTRNYVKDDLYFGEEIARIISVFLDNILLFKRVKDIEKRYRLITERVSDLITMVDPNGTIIYSSPSWQRLLGYTSSDLIGINWFNKILHPDDIPDVYKYIKKALEGELIVSPPFRFKHKNGNWVYIVSAGSLIIDDNKTNRVIFVSHDVSDRIFLDKTKNDFLSMASHELKTPITSLKIYLEILQKELHGTQNTRAIYLSKKINEQTNKLKELVNDMLDISRIESGKFILHKEVFSINELIKESIDVTVTLTDKHTIIFDDKKTLTIYADRYRIYQVLINILSNAIKYSPMGGDVIVKIQDEKLNAIISIQDFGIGINKDQHEKIFEKLYQVPGKSENTFPGLGIGLYISRKVILHHNGKIWVSSKKGKGSIFFITLPLNQDIYLN